MGSQSMKEAGTIFGALGGVLGGLLLSMVTRLGWARSRSSYWSGARWGSGWMTGHGGTRRAMKREAWHDQTARVVGVLPGLPSLVLHRAPLAPGAH